MEKLKPLMIFRNTWYQNLDDGYVILLSANFSKEVNCELWKVAFSYKGMGSQTYYWNIEEVLKCEYLGYIPDLISTAQAMLSAKMPEKKRTDTENKYLNEDNETFNQTIDEFRPIITRLEMELKQCQENLKCQNDSSR